MNEPIDLTQYYTAAQAAQRLSLNSGRTVPVSCVRDLTRQGKVTPIKIDGWLTLYPREQIDVCIVEARGVKARRVRLEQLRKAREERQAA